MSNKMKIFVALTFLVIAAVIAEDLRFEAPAAPKLSIHQFNTCKDVAGHCTYWKSKGLCNGRYATFMKKKCRKTCDKCKCIDLLPGTCLHLTNVLSCKNSCVSELCKDTCNCKSPAKNSRIESEPRLGLPLSGNRFLVPTAPPKTKNSCKDVAGYCTYWKSKGLCDGRYAPYMKKNCRKTCEKCNCIDQLQPGTCLHMKNVLTCKNRCVSELCKDTCNNCKKVNCKSSWSQWTSCTKSCGKGSQERKRTITSIAKNGGKKCVGRNKERRSCNIQKCQVHCKWSSWGKWTSCSKSCGHGVRYRSRRKVQAAKHGGRRCNGSNRTKQSCSIRKKCPVPCQWSSWGGWSSCSSKCGYGVRQRTRRIGRHAKNGGRSCNGSSSQRTSCYVRGRGYARYRYRGGCATRRNRWPRTFGHRPLRPGSFSRCRELCKRNCNCGWFEYCFGSNCRGNCILNRKSTPITTGNGYPSVRCYKLTRY